MSDIAKWGLLAGAAVLIVGLIFALPFVQYIDLGEFGAAINNIVSVCADFFAGARGIINCFLLPFGRTLLSGIMVWLIGKWALMNGIKIVVGIYHFVFK